ncbi:MAG TPA: PIN domain-containing protein [Methylibium sp.]|nr:PIN domain-containing protein [Methylibium sp.]
MFHILVDTSVWLDLAADQRQSSLLDVLIEFLGEGQTTLVLPSTVVNEFHKNRERVAKASAKSLASHFGQVREAIRKIDGDKRQKDKVLDFLADVDHRIPLIGGAAQATLDRMDELFKKTTVVEPSEQVKARAAERGINRKAPCHHENKNSMADAVLIETYFEYVKSRNGPGNRFAFVTHNKNDFSLANGNQKLPHTDIAAGFSKIKSMYFINLADCLRRVDPMRVTHMMSELEWDQQPRGLTEILKWESRLTTQVWHNRHMNREYMVENGKMKIVTKAEWEAARSKTGKYSQNLIVDEIWKGALKAARAAKKKLGPGVEGAGPYDDFEWGMINGKLSALRWVLGEDWDELYT